MSTLGMLLADLWADRGRALLSLLTLVLMSMGAMLLSGFAESVRLFGAPDAARRSGWRRRSRREGCFRLRRAGSFRLRRAGSFRLRRAGK